MKEDLKKANLGVGMHLPKEWRGSRKQLYPVMQSGKSKGNNVRFIGEKLFISGQLTNQRLNDRKRSTLLFYHGM